MTIFADMKKLFALLFAGVLLLAACEPYKDLRITSVEIVSVNPTSIRSVDAVVKLKVYNPSYGFTLSDMSGVLRMEDRTIAELSCPMLEIKANSLEEYEVTASGKLVQGAAMSAVGALLGDPHKLNADVSGTIRGPLGMKRAFEMKNVTLD